MITEELEGNVIDLEGHELLAVELGHTDTDHTTCLHVPSIGLVVAGDAAYNDVHLYLAESNVERRQEWIAALDKIQSLNPRAVVASLERPENVATPGSACDPPIRSDSTASFCRKALGDVLEEAR